MALGTWPLIDRLSEHDHVLVAGAGGGFDVFCGLPLVMWLRDAGKQVTLANLSFSNLNQTTNAEQLTPHVFTVRADTDGSTGYFPEKFLSQWFLETTGEDVPVYSFLKVGARMLRAAYEAVLARTQATCIVVVDGGTDALMCGDEVGLGTPHEDMTTIAAVDDLDVDSYLVSLGFGVDTFHGVSHGLVLEAVAELSTQGAFLGAHSLLTSMPEVQRYIEAVEFVHERMPHRPSIVNASIVSALEGDFGDVHRTQRTMGSELFINPLMGLYWAFEMGALADRVLYLEDLKPTIYFRDVVLLIEAFRSQQRDVRGWVTIPH